MKKTLIILALALLTGLGGAQAHAEDGNDPGQQKDRAILLAVGAGSTLLFDALFDTLPDPQGKTPLVLKRLAVLTFASLSTLGWEAARQSIAQENGLNSSNLTAGALGVAFATSWAF